MPQGYRRYGDFYIGREWIGFVDFDLKLDVWLCYNQCIEKLNRVLWR